MTVIGGQTAAGHDAVDMRMLLEGLSPGVQDGKHTDLRSEMLPVGCHFEQRGTAALEQQARTGAASSATSGAQARAAH